MQRWGGCRILPSIDVEIKGPVFHQSFPALWQHTLPWIGMWHLLTIETPPSPHMSSLGQVHKATLFLGASWPVAISFVLGIQMREQTYEDHKLPNVSNFWWMANEPKLILDSVLCSVHSSSSHNEDWVFRNYIHPKSSKDQENKWAPVQWTREFKSWPLARDSQTTPKFQSQTVMRRKRQKE